MLRFALMALFLMLPAALHAQVPGGVEPLTISLNPQYPRPYQTVTVTPGSTLIDLSASTVTISANGKVISRGSGTAPANVVMGGPGTLTTISVTAVHEGKTYSTELRLRPGDVALIIEPVTSAHPFYLGGTGVASEGALRIVALPEFRNASGVRIPPENLVYTWRLGDRILQAQSGIGKSYLSASAPVRFRDTRVTLTVTTQDSSMVAQATALVSPIDPVVRIYANDPLLGPLFNRALSSSFTMEGDEQTFRAVPYHFSGGAALTWLVNGSENGSDRDITLRATGVGGGTATLAARVKNASTFETGEARLSVKFGNSGGLGIFGL